MANTANLTGVGHLGVAIADPLIGSITLNTAQILEVTAQGEVNVATTLTEVQLGVKVQGKTATEVQQAAAQRSTAVVDVLRNLGAQELQTTSIQLNPVYSDENNTQTLIGLEDVLKVPEGIILPFDSFKTSSQSGITQLSQARGVV